MTTKALGVLCLLLAPAAIAYLAGYNEAAHYVGLGAVLALQLSVLARPVAANQLPEEMARIGERARLASDRTLPARRVRVGSALHGVVQ